MYGNQYINLLVLSVCVLGCAIPIYWTELDGRGNSNTEQRKELLAKFVTRLSADRIDYFTAKDRIGNLSKLIILALTICYLIGLVRASHQPITVKTYGYKQNSFFRYGYDLLIQKLNNNLYDAIKLISRCISYLLMEVKCKKLISVM